MDLFYEPHQAAIKAMLHCQVEFILIGGYAVNYHGYNRPTGDLDLWLQPTEANKQKMLDFIAYMDFSDESRDYIQSLNFTEAEVFFMGTPPVRIDFLTRISGIEYEDAAKQAIIADVEGMKIPILHLSHLILSKISTGRPKDKIDIEELQRINRNKL